MKKLIEIKRGYLVPDHATLIKPNSKQTKEHAPQGGYMNVTWDLWEVREDNE